MKKNYYAKALALTVAASMVSVPAFAAEGTDDPQAQEETVEQDEQKGEKSAEEDEIVAYSDADDTPIQATSGYCGDPEVNEGKNVEWAFDTDTGVLTISGTGVIADDPANKKNWAEFAKDIKEIRVNDGITALPHNLIRNTEGATVYVPKTVELIPYEDKNPFANGSEVKIILDKENPNYVMENGVVFTADKKVLIKYTMDAPADYTIPDGVEIIASRGFSQVSKLTSVSIPSTVKKIDTYAF